ncbi:hypothetical protein SK803_06925 [Lentzea sp. BCCO 10_0856]|uniref:Uncharacterized protein n=1 Tax=Lentzea miocenica TaxID=3095431 RepID=A0ABU4SVP1_9PSEU|nr:hypothetical protein [Lentzea sp. BCCO 10_0856]MDX8029938.1 hypothetical protein [Lentzea sp. BCCO 10_0856]
MTFPYDQARLQALINDVDSKIDDLGKVATAASHVQRRSRGLSEQDLAEIERFAKSPGAPKELKDLQRRVDAGEMSWADVASGRAINDEGVQKALAVGVPDLQRAYRAIEEGQDIDDIIASGNPVPQPPVRSRRADDDDEDDGPSHFRKDAW